MGRQPLYLNSRLAAVLAGFIALSASAGPLPPANEPGSALRGQDAVARLKQSCAYDSLERTLRTALYSIEHTYGDYSARNPVQGIEVSFRLSGTRIVHGDHAVALRLRAFGRGERLREPAPGTLVSSGNRLEYKRGALTEWYSNDARGLEQGFTLTERPEPVTGGDVVVALDITGTLRPAIAAGEVSLLDSAGHTVLRYGGLKAWDAAGHALASELELRGREVRLIVGDEQATYPITIDPTVTAVTLLASDGLSADRFGQAIAMSGNTAVIGANFKNSLQGAAYVFGLAAKNWTQQTKLTASDGAVGDQFGASVSLNANTAIVGAPGKTSGQGTAYIFVLSNGTWVQQAELTASDAAAGDQFGIAVSVNGDTAVVGAASQASAQGAAYVFVRSGTSWTQQAKLTASDGAAGDQLGAAVSINGATAVAGAPGADSLLGAAYVFVQSGTSWTEQVKLTGSDGAAGDSFGKSVSISLNTIVVGAAARNSGRGTAYVFARSGTNWNQQVELTASDGKAGDGFGRSVSVDGSTIVAGANSKFFNTGAAYVFVSSGASWTQQAELAASDATQSFQFAFSVAVSGDTIAAGAPIQYNSQGEGYFFARSGSNWTQQSEVAASDAANPDLFGSSIALSGDTAVVGSFFHNHFQGAAYVFVRSNGAWTQQAKLLPTDAAGGDFGNAVSADANTVVIGAYLQASNKGAAYVFVRSGTSWTQQAKLTASDGAAGDFFGYSVSVSGDTALIGASGHSTGAAYVFVRSGSSWALQATLTAADGTKGDGFGAAVSIDVDTALVGAFAKNAHGAAYVFTRSGTSWAQQAELTASDSAKGDFFGFSAALNGDTAIVGAYLKGPGAAYVFVRSGTAWPQQAKLVPSDGTGQALFGHAASLDGDLAVIGSPGSDGREGSVYVFSRSGTSWTQLTKLAAAGGAPGDNEGWSVAISGGTMVTGAIGSVASRGAAYVFPLPNISSGGIVHAASFAHTIAPGSIASVFGINFGTANTPAGSLPLPTVLDQVSVTVNGTLAPLIFVGELQANIQIPFETPPGTATVVVTANSIPSPPATVTVMALAPGIFVAGANQAVVLNPDNSVADGRHPAKVANVEVMYVTGLGTLDHPIPTGSPASSNPVSNAKVVPTVTVGGSNAVVQFAGMTPGFVGLGQINFVVPKLAKGSYPVVVTQGGQTSNNPVMTVTP